MIRYQELLHTRLGQRGALARLAHESGLKSQVIARWRDGTVRPRPANLWRVAPALGVSYEELMRMCGYLPDMASAPRPSQDPRLERLIHSWPTMDEAVKDWLADAAQRRVRRRQLAQDET